MLKMIKDSPISVITVTYNSSPNIKQFLDSIVSNSFINRIIIIENNSKDAKITKKIVLGYKSKKILFIDNKKNDGFGKSCNRGGQVSDDEYLLFANPDTQFNKNSVSLLLEHAVTSKADIIGGKSLTFSGKRHLTVVRKPNLKIGLFEFSNLGKLFSTNVGHQSFYYLDKNNVTFAKKDVVVDGVGGAYLMIKRNSFKKLKGFDEKFFMYLEDVDLSIRAKTMGMKVVYCPHSVIKHIGGASSDNKYRIKHQAWFDSRKYYYKKHFGFLTNVIIQPLYILEEFLLKKFRKI
jgi:GT2 family glycosyltransferase